MNDRDFYQSLLSYEEQSREWSEAAEHFIQLRKVAYALPGAAIGAGLGFAGGALTAKPDAQGQKHWLKRGLVGAGVGAGVGAAGGYAGKKLLGSGAGLTAEKGLAQEGKALAQGGEAAAHAPAPHPQAQATAPRQAPKAPQRGEIGHPYYERDMELKAKGIDPLGGSTITRDPATGHTVETHKKLELAPGAPGASPEAQKHLSQWQAEEAAANPMGHAGERTPEQRAAWAQDLLQKRQQQANTGNLNYRLTGQAGPGKAKAASVLSPLRYALAKLGYEIDPEDRPDIPKKDFAQPQKEEAGHKGKYPIPDRQHAKSALGFAKMHGDSAALAAVKKKIQQKFPDMDVEGEEKDSCLMGKSAGYAGKGALVGGTLGTIGAGLSELKQRAKEEGTKSPEELKKIRRSRLKWRVGQAAGGAAGGAALGHFGAKGVSKIKENLKGGLKHLTGEAKGTVSHAADEARRTASHVGGEVRQTASHLGGEAEKALGKAQETAGSLGAEARRTSSHVAEEARKTNQGAVPRALVPESVARTADKLRDMLGGQKKYAAIFGRSTPREVEYGEIPYKNRREFYKEYVKEKAKEEPTGYLKGIGGGAAIGSGLGALGGLLSKGKVLPWALGGGALGGTVGGFAAAIDKNMIDAARRTEKAKNYDRGLADTLTRIKSSREITENLRDERRHREMVEALRNRG